MAATQCISACRRGEDDLLRFKVSSRMGKEEDLGDFERDMVVGARPAGLAVSQSALLDQRENIRSAAVVWSKMPC